MAQDHQFKVIIAGGSVAGLALANMLQLNNIDFVVLEAYPSIAPQVGASIGLLPHGNRILDQLGLFGKVMELAPPVDTFSFRDQDGAPLASYGGMSRAFTERHGYPMIFLDRQMLLQILYDNIADKSKILTGKRVTRVELRDRRVAAILSDKSAFEGDILIGADGVHSTVRGEMWRLAEELQPGLFDPSEREAPPCDYSCIFGISNPCNGLNSGEIHSVFRQHASCLVTGGPGGRVYWFRFQKLPERLHGSAIPRYTQADLDLELSKCADEKILPDVTFSALVENKVTAIMTPLPEYVYQKWHFDRIFNLGDSAHKFHPIGGHGGNAAIETAAALVNRLMEELERCPSGQLNTVQIESMFSDVQAIRRWRTVKVKNYSHKRQLTESLDTPLHRLVALHLLPWANEADVTRSFSAQFPASEKLNMIDISPRARLAPYKDELLAKPKSRGRYQWVLLLFYLICSALGFWGTKDSPVSWELGGQSSNATSTDFHSNHPTFLVKKSYIGISIIDNYLVRKVALFLPSLRFGNEELASLQRYAFGNSISLIAIWIVEAYRHRNSMTPLALLTFWFILLHFAGIGTTAPLYFAAYTLISNVESYWWPLNRFVPIHYARFMLPANIIAIVVPFVCLFTPPNDLITSQSLVVLWELWPILIPLFIKVLGGLYKSMVTNLSHDNSSLSANQKPYDLSSLNSIYFSACVCGALVHWHTIFELFASKDVDLAVQSVFMSFPSQNHASLEQAAKSGLLVNIFLFYTVSYIWCVAAMWDLRRVGRTQVDVILVAGIILIGNCVIGPGAIMSIVWYFRENILARHLFLKNGKTHQE